MLKDKIYTTLPPEDVVIRKSNLVEASADPAVDRFLARHKWLVIGMIVTLVILVVVLAGTHIWSQPVRTDVTVDIDMYAVRMAANCTLYERSTVRLLGTRLDYRDETMDPVLEVSECQLLGKTPLLRDVKLYWSSQYMLYGLCGDYLVTIELDPDGGWCVIQVVDYLGVTRYLACSTEENFDPVAIFESSVFAD